MHKAYEEGMHSPLTEYLYKTIKDTGIVTCINPGMESSSRFIPWNDLVFIASTQFSSDEPIIMAHSLTHEFAHVFQYNLVRDYLIKRGLIPENATLGQAFDKLYQCMPEKDAIKFFIFSEIMAETIAIAALLEREDSQDALRRTSGNLFSQMRPMTIYALGRILGLDLKGFTTHNDIQEFNVILKLIFSGSVSNLSEMDANSLNIYERSERIQKLAEQLQTEPLRPIEYKTLNPEEKSALLYDIALRWLENPQAIEYYLNSARHFSNQGRAQGISCTVEFEDLPLELFAVPGQNVTIFHPSQLDLFDFSDEGPKYEPY